MANKLSENTFPRFDHKNINDLESILVERKFGRPEDYIELSIADLKGNILQNIPDFTDYISPQGGDLTNEINIDPLKVLNTSGYSTGTYRIIINIQKRKIFNSKLPPFIIKEISPTRRELKVYTTLFSNSQLEINSEKFISEIQNSPYFRDFVINFPNNIKGVGINVDINTEDPNQYFLLLKTFKAIPENITVGDKLSISEDIIEPLTIKYDLGPSPIIDNTIPLRGPNFQIDTRLNKSLPTAFKSYDDILSTEVTSSYQKLISKLDGYEIPEIEYDYIRPIDTASDAFNAISPSHFENFVHFGSAVERLNAFEYKLKLIELYDIQLQEVLTISGSSVQTTEIKNITSSINTKKDNIIQGFDGYEQFLYYTTGSNPYTWPKTTSTEPYVLAHTTSSEVETWFGSGDSRNSFYGGQMLSASTFDSQNQNRLYKIIPHFIGDNPDNDAFLLFCDMVGNHFDPIWAHIKEISQIRNNEHRYGVSKNLVYYALKTLGIEAYDQFENEDLASYIFGNAVEGGTTNVITGSNEIFSKQDATKEIWKRLYHNAPYLLKTKGTERGLRALINCYGIPSTILDIKEFGSSNPNRDEFKLYSYDKYNKVLAGNSQDHEGFFIETNWSSSAAAALSASEKTVEFRINPIRSNDPYHLFTLSGSISSSDLHLLAHPYTGSHDFFHPDDRTQYGKLELHQFTSSIATSSGVGQIISPVELVENKAFNNNFGSELTDLNEPLSNGNGATITSATSLDFASNTSGGTEYVSNITSEDLVVGGVYKISVTVSNYAGTGDVGFSTSGGISVNARRSSNGVIEETFYLTAAGQPDVFINNGVTAATLSDISIKRIAPEWTVDSSNDASAVIENGTFISSNDGVSGFTKVDQAQTLTSGETYRLTFDVTAVTGTSVAIYNYCDSQTYTIDGNATVGTYTHEFVSTGVGGIDVRTIVGTGESITIDNISLKEVLIPEDGYFPLYNGEFWDIYLNTDGASGSNAELGFGAYQSNWLREVSAYTSSVTITEKENAEAFGNPYYNGGDNIIGSEKTYFCGIRDFVQNQQTSQSNYSVADSGSAFGLEYSGSLSEVRFYFGERLTHKTLRNHALEPLMYDGNSISSSYDHLILRFPLSFELELDHDTSTQLPSASALWNNSPTDTTGLVTPASNIGAGTPLQGLLTGGAVLSSSLDPYQTTSSSTTYSGQYFGTGSVPPGPPTYTVAGTPLLQSHHPNEDIEYLNGFTYMGPDQIEAVVELHHLPTPNTIGKSAVNRKIYIDSGSTDDDILSSDILSQLPTTTRQVPDFDHLGVFFSPQNELNEDIIYTLGTFSLDHTLGDPRQQTSSHYQDLTELSQQYFKKLARSKHNSTFDFIRWVQFTDHTLFELLKQFTPQKANLKAGLLIEPHYLERSKFQRSHPITQHTFSPTSSLYEATIRELDRPLSASFKQGNYNGKRIGYNNISALDATTGSAVISYSTINPPPIKNLVFNGTFDENIEGWQLVLTGNETIEWVSYSPLSSSPKLKFTSDSSWDGVYQSFSVIPNTQYQISFYLEGETGNSNNVYFRVSFGNPDIHETNYVSVARTPGAYGSFVREFTAPPTATVANVHLMANGGDIGYIDDVEVIQIPVEDKSRGIDSTIGYNTNILIDKQITGSSAWEQGPLLPTTSNSNLNSSKASLFLNFSGNTGENMFITLTSADGTVRTYKAADTSDPNITHGTVLADGSIAFNGLTGDDGKGNSLRTAILSDNGHGGKLTVSTVNSAGKMTITQTIPGTVGNTLVTQGFTSGVNDFDYLLDSTGKVRNFEGGGLPKVPRYRISSGSNELRPWTLTPYGNFMNSRVSKKVFESNKAVSSSGDIEFDDGLLRMESWKLPRYKGSRLIGSKINEYTVGDTTYGLNPVAEQNSSVLYFGKTIIGADGEDDNLVTIKNHSYISIEKMVVIDKKRDKVTVLEPKNETYKGMNRYISKDLGPGSSFHLELLDEGISNKLKNKYTSKFNQGYLYKVLEHKGINGTGNVYGQGIQVGYVDVSTEPFPYKSTTQNILMYGDYDNTINSDTISLKKNTLTKKIFPNYQSFGQIDFITGSATNNYYDSMDNLSMFINSMLIPVASESQHRLFGTFNYGQPVQVADYTIEANKGIKSISTVEFDLESYVVTSSLHDQISGSGNMSGFGKALVRPDHLAIPIMRGAHDIITDKKAGAGITWPGNGSTNGRSHSGADAIQTQYYFSGDSRYNAIYQISYLEESQVIIADVDKPTELTDDVGDKGYIIIPNNLDTEIKDNLDYWLEQSGYKDIKIPKSKEDKVPPRNG